MNGGYADTLLLMERAHLVRLLWWGSVAAVAGLALLILQRRSQARTPLLFHFALQSALWGLIDVVIVAAAWRGLGLRDHASAMGLDRFLWLNIGLDTGYVLTGVVLAVAGWLMGKRLGVVGAGIGIAVQGTALAALDLMLALQVDAIL